MSNHFKLAKPVQVTCFCLAREESWPSAISAQPQRMWRVRAALQQSPRHSARHSVALGMSDRSFRRMLHMNLHFHPLKIQMVQELLPCDLNM
jgi:hypothetical protein